MTEAMKALDEIVDVLCKHLGPQVLNQDVASDIDIDRHDDFRSDMQEVAADILALPTLRAALAPVTDEAKNRALLIEMLKTLDVTSPMYKADFIAMNLKEIVTAMGELAYSQASAPVTDEEVAGIQSRHVDDCYYAELSCYPQGQERLLQAHADRATLLAHVDRLSAELAAERERRVEADMFWDYYDPEQPYYSVEELVQEREYEGEGIVQVQEAIRCPDAAYIYRIKNDPETDDREIVLERLSDADHVHYRASMAVARGAREMWGVMVDRLAAQLFEENPAPVPERMHTCQWKNLDWHYRKHHRSLAHDRLAATLTKD